MRPVVDVFIDSRTGEYALIHWVVVPAGIGSAMGMLPWGPVQRLRPERMKEQGKAIIIGSLHEMHGRRADASPEKVGSALLEDQEGLNVMMKVVAELSVADDTVLLRAQEPDLRQASHRDTGDVIAVPTDSPASLFWTMLRRAFDLYRSVPRE